MEAAVGVVGGVGRVLEFEARDHLVADAELLGEGHGIALVGGGNGRRIGGDGDSRVAEGLAGSPGEISRIGAAGIGDEHAAEGAQDAEQPLFFNRSEAASSGTGATV